MRIERLSVENVRNLSGVTLTPGPGMNLIRGPNGSGKTALLESIYLMSRGRSFRTPRIEDVVRNGAQELAVYADLRLEAGRRLSAGVERGAGRLALLVDDEPVKTVSAQARQLPMVVFTPDNQRLVLGGPKERRRWLDWALFHVEPAYLDQWRTYHKALRQRNVLLKRRAPPREFEGWEKTMGSSAQALTMARRGILREIGRAVHDGAGVLGAGDPKLELDPGWDGETPLEAALAAGRGVDTVRGYSGAGPHRADVRFLAAGQELARVYSRGQAKRFLALLLMGQARVMVARAGTAPLVLVDDFTSELDEDAQAWLREQLLGLEMQVFVTSAVGLPAALDQEAVVFHVKHGEIVKMVE